MNQIFRKGDSVLKILDQMSKNKTNEITRILFLPNSDGVLISFNTK